MDLPHQTSEERPATICGLHYIDQHTIIVIADGLDDDATPPCTLSPTLIPPYSVGLGSTQDLAEVLYTFPQVVSDVLCEKYSTPREGAKVSGLCFERFHLPICLCFLASWLAPILARVMYSALNGGCSGIITKHQRRLALVPLFPHA